MKKYIKSTTWNDLSPSEQMAVEYASQAYEGSGYNLDDAVQHGCNRVSQGNVEPEYEDEDFYGAEPNEEKVFNYLFDQYTREGRKIYRTPYINASTSAEISKFDEVYTILKQAYHKIESEPKYANIDDEDRLYRAFCKLAWPELKRILQDVVNDGLDDLTQFYWDNDQLGEDVYSEAIKKTKKQRSNVSASTNTDSYLMTQRKSYIYKCLEDAPQIPESDPDEYPETWSQYYRDSHEYMMWCFADGVEDGLFEEGGLERIQETLG